jgi:hypothetical protein
MILQTTEFVLAISGWAETFMRILLAVMTAGIVFLGAESGLHAQTQEKNTAPLHGGSPLNFNVLPGVPPNGFYAWCQTSPGICLVEGNAPIAPGSVCHCGQYEGRTK